MRSFVDALKREIAGKRDFFKDNQSIPDTIYFGGGTPSSLPVDWLAEITDLIVKTYSPDIKEFTVEVNPEDVNRRLLSGLKAIGVNRISMGAQSFHDRHLIWMNRRHNSDDTINAFNMMRSAGFDNISLDLIFGYEMLSDEEWDYNIDTLVSLSPEHVSAYQLGVEANSTLAEMIDNGDYAEMDDENSSRQYAMLQSALKDGGFNQYEISNFSRKGREAIHNSSYWNRAPYLGLGPSAHSYSGNVRSWNIDILDRYTAALLKDQPNNSYIRNERLSENDIFNEKIMLGLRKVEGVKLASLDKERLILKNQEINYLESSGSLIVEKGRMRIPSDKLFISDSIISQLFV